jgi:drug/metabolite transporter (DMT)-like permease
MHRTRAILMLILATAAWGYSFPAGKALLAALGRDLPGRDGLTLSALLIGARFALAALLMWLVQPRAFAQMRAEEWRQVLGLGLFGGLGMLFQCDGLNHTTASAVAFLTQFSAVLVPVVVAVRLRRLPSLFTIVCVAMVIIGVAILGQFDRRQLRFGRGEVETLLSSFFFTAQILCLEVPQWRGNHSGRVSMIMFGMVALVLAPVFLARALSPADARALFVSGPNVAVFLSLTGICSLVAFLLMNRWQPHVDATTAGIVYCAEPLFATAFALFTPALLAPVLHVEYANESLTPNLLLGGTLITAANVLIALKPPTAVRAD